MDRVELRVVFDGTMSAKDVADKIADICSLEYVDVFLSGDMPCIRFTIENDDGEKEQRTRSLMNIDDLLQECLNDPCCEMFNETMGYVYSCWGKTDSGEWRFGYVV